MVDNPAYWDDATEGAIVASIRRAKSATKQNRKEEFEFAIDYLNNRQRDDVETELRTSFPASMSGDSGQQIRPVTVPLTERYVAEAANAYNRTVRRTLTWPDGTEDDTTRNETAALNKALEDSEYDETMHQCERMTVLLGTMTSWHSFKKNKLKVELVYPQDVWPVSDNDLVHCDQSDPDDYNGFVIQTIGKIEDTYSVEPLSFAFVQKEGTSFYVGMGYNEPRKIVAAHPNPFMWPQISSESAYQPNASLSDLPILPLVFWNKTKQTDRLIADMEPDIAYANRELNIQMSMIFDTMRIQGYDILIKKLLNPRDPKAIQKHGARFPVVLDIGEDASYAGSSAPYSALVDVIAKFVKMIAITKRMSPNDFSTEAASPASGFAKLVDSLPKIEARKERIKRLKAIEEHRAWPCNGAILIWSGALSEQAKNMRLRADFADVEFPMTADEITKKHDDEIKYNVISPIQMIMDKYGVDEARADEIYQKNESFKAPVAPAQKEETPEEPETPSALLGRLIARKKSVKQEVE